MSTLPSVETIVAKLDAWSEAYDADTSENIVEDVQTELESMAETLRTIAEQIADAQKHLHELEQDMDVELELAFVDRVGELDWPWTQADTAAGELEDLARKLGTVR